MLFVLAPAKSRVEQTSKKNEESRSCGFIACRVLVTLPKVILGQQPAAIAETKDLRKVDCGLVNEFLLQFFLYFRNVHSGSRLENGQHAAYLAVEVSGLAKEFAEMDSLVLSVAKEAEESKKIVIQT